MRHTGTSLFPASLFPASLHLAGLRTAGLLLAALICSGCATMSVTECRGQDWYEIGYSDAASGLGTAKFLEYQNSCAQHGINPHRTRYLSGWSEGRNKASKT